MLGVLEVLPLSYPVTALVGQSADRRGHPSAPSENAGNVCYDGIPPRHGASESFDQWCWKLRPSKKGQEEMGHAIAVEDCIRVDVHGVCGMHEQAK